MKYRIIVPVHNEEKYIKRFIESFPKKHRSFLIIVDDGSTDKTFQIIKETAPEIKILKHKVNLGKGKSLETGILQAKKENTDIVVLMDGDLQHKPSDIDKFLETLEKTPETDIVFGARIMGKNMKLIPFVGNKFLTVITNLLFKYFLNDTQCGFRAFRTHCFDKMRWKSSGYQAETEMIINAAKNKLNYKEVAIDTIYLDDYKGTSILDGIKILSKILKMKLIKNK